MEIILIKPLERDDEEWVKTILEKQWGSVKVVARGKVINALKLPGFKAVLNRGNVGLITYFLDKADCEIVTLDSLAEGEGVGSKLIEEVIRIAKENRCRRVWLITTNDNLNALRFYQKRGFVLAALYPNALVQSRKLKPEIPKTGIDGLPLRDEIELEMKLD